MYVPYVFGDHATMLLILVTTTTVPANSHSTLIVETFNLITKMEHTSPTTVADNRIFRCSLPLKRKDETSPEEGAVNHPERPDSTTKEEARIHLPVATEDAEKDDCTSILISSLQEQLKKAQDLATRRGAMTLLYQDELRRLVDARLRDEPGNIAFREEWRVTRQSLRNVQEIVEEHSAITALQRATNERDEWKGIAVQGGTKLVAQEIEHQYLETCLEQERRQLGQVGRERDHLELENARLAASLQIFKQRAVVAELERNQLRRNVLQSKAGRDGISSILG